jgi:hypothetical protein
MEASDNSIPSEWLAEFEAAAKRQLATRMRDAFIKTCKPVLDDALYRSFDDPSTPWRSTVAGVKRTCPTG